MNYCNSHPECHYQCFHWISDYPWYQISVSDLPLLMEHVVKMTSSGKVKSRWKSWLSNDLVTFSTLCHFGTVMNFLQIHVVVVVAAAGLTARIVLIIVIIGDAINIGAMISLNEVYRFRKFEEKKKTKIKHFISEQSFFSRFHLNLHDFIWWIARTCATNSMLTFVEFMNLKEMKQTF